MDEPRDGQTVEQDQVDVAINKGDYSDAVPGSKGWHTGDAPGWFLQDPNKWGYSSSDLILYGEVNAGGESLHLYWVPSKGRTVIVPRGGTPTDPSTW